MVEETSGMESQDYHCLLINLQMKQQFELQEETISILPLHVNK